MQLKLYKKLALQVGLWMGSVAAAALLVGLVLFFCLKFDNHKERLGFALEYAFGVFFVFLLFFCSTLNRVFYRTMIRINRVVFEDDSEEIQFTVNIFAHIMIVLISTVIFFLIISCHMMVMHTSWNNAALSTIWINIITFSYNIIFMYLYIYIFNYRLNQSAGFKENLAETLKAQENAASDELKNNSIPEEAKKEVIPDDPIDK